MVSAGLAHQVARARRTPAVAPRARAASRGPGAARWSGWPASPRRRPRAGAARRVAGGASTSPLGPSRVATAAPIAAARQRAGRKRRGHDEPAHPTAPAAPPAPRTARPPAAATRPAQRLRAAAAPPGERDEGRDEDHGPQPQDHAGTGVAAQAGRRQRGGHDQRQPARAGTAPGALTVGVMTCRPARRGSRPTRRRRRAIVPATPCGGGGDRGRRKERHRVVRERRGPEAAARPANPSRSAA